MLVKNIHKNIQETLEARRRALSRKEPAANEESLPNNVPTFSDLASRSTYVRMVSNKDDVTDTRVIQGGELADSDDDSRTTTFGFDGFLGPYKNIRSGGVSKTEGIRHISGIKDISVEYLGDYKAVRKATINWVVNSLRDLVDLTPHFLTVGKTVLLDWGWVYKRKELNNYTTFFSPDDTRENSIRIINQDVFNDPMPIIYQSNGNYDAIGGVISNFEYKLRDDGGFDCVTYITSIGISLIDGNQIDKGSTEFQLTSDASGNVSQVHVDNVINAVMNLDYLLDDYVGVKYSDFNDSILPGPTNSLGETQSEGSQAAAERMTGGGASATIGSTDPYRRGPG